MTSIHDKSSGIAEHASKITEEVLPDTIQAVVAPPPCIVPSSRAILERHEAQDKPNTIPKRSKLQLVTIMSMIYFSVFLAALDTTITTTAIPTIASHFSSSTGYTWVGSAYLVAVASTTPSWSKISDIFGRKPAMLLSLVIFFFGSLICGVSTTITMLITGRAVQGTGGGGILLISSVVTGDLFSIRSRGMIFSFQALVYAVAAGVGPVLGGTFAEVLSWRWCFYITLPSSAVTFILLAIFLDLHTPRTPLLAGLAAIDWLGSISVIGATLSLLLGLEFGGVIFAWNSVKIIVLLILGFVLSIFFFFNEKRWALYPVMPFRLFVSHSNVACLVVGGLHSVTFFSFTYYLPLYAQSVLLYSPLRSGVFLLPFEVSLSLTAGICGLLIKITGHYVPQIYIGLSLQVLSLTLLVALLKGSLPSSVLLVIELIGGIGTGLAMTSPLIALQSGVLIKDNATATGTFRFMRELSAAISIVLGGVVFQNAIQSQHTELTDKIGAKAAEMFTGKNAASNVLLVQGLEEMERAVVRQAFAQALRRMWGLFLATAVVALVASLWIVKRSLSKVHEEGRLGLDDKRPVAVSLEVELESQVQ